MRYILIFVFLLFSHASNAETLQLKDGTTLKGKIIDGNSESLNIQLDSNEIVTANINDIQSFYQDVPNSPDPDEIIRVSNMVSQEPYVIKNIFYKAGQEIARQKWTINIDDFMDFDPQNAVMPQPTLLGQDGQIPDGAVNEYGPNGKLAKMDTYQNNKLNGISRAYHENGNVLVELNSKNGEIVSGKYFNDAGILENEGTFENGKIVYMKLYDENGNIIQEGDPSEEENQ